MCVYIYTYTLGWLMHLLSLLPSMEKGSRTNTHLGGFQPYLVSDYSCCKLLAEVLKNSSPFFFSPPSLQMIYIHYIFFITHSYQFSRRGLQGVILMICVRTPRQYYGTPGLCFKWMIRQCHLIFPYYSSSLLKEEKRPPTDKRECKANESTRGRLCASVSVPC